MSTLFPKVFKKVYKKVLIYIYLVLCYNEYGDIFYSIYSVLSGLSLVKNKPEQYLKWCSAI